MCSPNDDSSWTQFLQSFKDFLNSRPDIIKNVDETKAQQLEGQSTIITDLTTWITELLDNPELQESLRPLDITNTPISLPKELRTLKICLIGDWAVGKTTLRRKYMGLSLVPNYLPTLGADFSHYRTIYQDYPFELLIWDLAGQPRFQTVRKHYFLGSFGSVVVFDVTRPETFFRMFFWIEEFYKQVKAVKPIVILGNKIDLVTSKEQEQQVQNFDLFCAHFQRKMLDDHDILVGYLKTSALTGANVKEGFELLLHSILKWIQDEQHQHH